MVYNIPITDLVFSRLPATLELVFVSVCIATLIGIPSGLYSGYRPGTAGARAIMALSVLGFSVPTFWIGMLLIMTFAVQFGWLPSGGAAIWEPSCGSRPRWRLARAEAS